MSFVAWRHPRPTGHEGRCIGRTDVRVDPRRARRLARRIHRHASRHGHPKIVCTSSLRRCHAVGRCLRRLGWLHVVDDRLLEADFGVWDGQPWAQIAREAVDAWVADFLHHAPGGGESLAQVLVRAQRWSPPQPGVAVVAHAGWMVARRLLAQHGPANPPTHAAQWPRPPAYGEAWHCSLGGVISSVARPQPATGRFAPAS